MYKPTEEKKYSIRLSVSKWYENIEKPFCISNKSNWPGDASYRPFLLHFCSVSVLFWVYVCIHSYDQLTGFFFNFFLWPTALSCGRFGPVVCKRFSDGMGRL